MSYVSPEIYGLRGILGDLGGRMRVSQTRTLFDGKTLNTDDATRFENSGTGTATFNTNQCNLAVTAGQYIIRNSPHTNPYFSGKVQDVEFTFDSFAPETNVVKRVGYFSSNAVAPYDSDKDGFWLESDGTTIRLIVSRFGTEVVNVPWTSWDAYSTISGYDWDNFTVCYADFLWLGGAGLRLFLKFEGGFVLAHTIMYAGTATNVFMRSPNQPMRYEVRSTGGAGGMNAICCQVATEGIAVEQGNAIALLSPTSGISANAVGTTYALRGVRKLATQRDIHTDITGFGGAIVTSGSVDAGRFLLLYRPTLSAPLVYATNGRLDDGAATTQTVTGLGTVIAVAEAVGSGESQSLAENYLASLLSSIDNTMHEVVLAYQPYTANQTVYGHIALRVG